MTLRRRQAGTALALLMFVGSSAAVGAQVADQYEGGEAPAAPAPQARVSYSSSGGERQHCAADTSAGVVLARSIGSAPCLLGKTWGYDDTGVFVSEGCSG